MRRGSQKILVWHTVLGKGQGQQSSYSSGLYCLKIVKMVTESAFHDEKCIQSRSLAEKWPLDWNTEILDILKSRLSPSHRIESIFGNNDTKLQWFPIRFHPPQLTQLCVNTLVERLWVVPARCTCNTLIASIDLFSKNTWIQQWSGSYIHPIQYQDHYHRRSWIPANWRNDARMASSLRSSRFLHMVLWATRVARTGKILAAVVSATYKCWQGIARPVIIVNNNRTYFEDNYPVFVFISFHNVINIRPPIPRNVSCSPT